jgi:hypothetical protein
MNPIYSKPKPLQFSLHKIVCNMPKHEVDDLLPALLMECGLQEFGYNRRRDEYWGKKGGAHFTVAFTNKNAGVAMCSTIVLAYWGSNEKDANKIYNKLHEMATIMEEFMNCLQL